MLLPRSYMVAVVRAALCTLSQMVEFSKLARQGVKVLKELVATLSLNRREKDTILAEPIERRDRRQIFDPEAFGEKPISSLSRAPGSTFQPLDAQESSFGMGLLGVSGDSTSTARSNNIFVEPLDLEWRDSIDLGILYDVFHWDSLGI
jgi:hypothetical protein